MMSKQESLMAIQEALQEIRDLRQEISGLMDQVGEKFRFVSRAVDELLKDASCVDEDHAVDTAEGNAETTPAPS
jgi:hypothetical protein